MIPVVIWLVLGPLIYFDTSPDCLLWYKPGLFPELRPENRTLRPGPSDTNANLTKAHPCYSGKAFLSRRKRIDY